MPQVKWIIEDVFGYDDDSTERFVEAAKDQGHDVQVISYELSSARPDLDRYADDDCILFRGSLGMARELQRSRPWIPGVIANFPNFHFAQWSARWGNLLLSEEYMMLPYAEFLRRRDWVFEQMGSHGRVFVRPDDGFKSFAGQVVGEDLINTASDPLATGPERIIVVAREVEIHDEYRFVMREGRPIAASRYMTDGALDLEEGAPEEAWALAREIGGHQWQPDVMYTLDLARRPDGPFRLLEANSFSAADIYACDPAPVVMAAAEVAIADWEDINLPV